MKTIFTFAFVLFGSYLFCQEVILLEQNFNFCELPSDWSVEIAGNQEAVWYIGQPDNPESDGSTIDGTCMFIIDDDLTGENTDSFNLRVLSPQFSIGNFPTIELNIDIHFRHATDEAFRVLITDGTQEFMIANYEDRNFAGEQFSQFVTLTADMSFYPEGEYQLILEYNDGNQWGWWAGFDNILIKGVGEGNIQLSENFNDCNLPQGWAVMNINGDETWQIGYLENGNAWQSSSLNGSCFAYFDDDILGEDSAPSTAGIVSPFFNLSEFKDYYLEFDMIFRQYAVTEWLEVGIIVGNERIPVHSFTTQQGGEQLDEFVSQKLDLSKFKSEQARLYFLYHDGGEWAWWAGIDNIKLVGNGLINDKCSTAFALNLNDTLDFSTSHAFGDKTVPSECNPNFEKALWYYFEVSNSINHQIEITNDFNGVIEIFKGNVCSQLELVSCIDADEYGFYGEKITNQWEIGTHFLRISGKETEFGGSSGNGQLFLITTDSLNSQPENLDCFESIVIIPEVDTIISGHNKNADFSLIVPSDNYRSRSDVWFSFTAGEEPSLIVNVIADFANNITAYSGTCEEPIEFATNYSGEELILEDLIADEVYFLQVSGNFSTLEGNFELYLKTPEETLENFDCVSAATAMTDGQCAQFDNTKEGFSGISPTCDPLAESDRWYKFNAPASGNLAFRFQADFMYTLSVYEVKDCEDLNSIYCNRDFHFCDGYEKISGLTAGSEYYIQISSSGRVSGFNKGRGCLSLFDGSQNLEWESIAMTAEMICASKDAVLIQPTATGGSGDYSYYGQGIVDLIPSNTNFFIEATDIDGCIATLEGTTPDCSEVECNIFFEMVARNVSCYGNNDGSVEIFATGGLAPYSILGANSNGTSYILDLAPGTYQFTAQDAAGCQEVFEVTIEEAEPINWQVNEFVDTSEEGGLVEISVEGGEGLLEITWLKDEEVYNIGSNRIENLPPGEYYAEIKDENNCIIKTDIFTILLFTSQSLTDLNSSWKAFPNPFSEQIHLSFSGNLSSEYNLIVTSVLGVEMHRQKILAESGNQINLTTATWPPGIYNLLISNDIHQDHKILVKTK